MCILFDYIYICLLFTVMDLLVHPVKRNSENELACVLFQELNHGLWRESQN